MTTFGVLRSESSDGKGSGSVTSRGTAQLVSVQSGDEGELVDDGAARDVGNVGERGVGGVEEGELDGRKEGIVSLL